MPAPVPGFSLQRFSIEGKVAIVTGGSDGIGRGIAHGFADVGAKVTIAARRQEKIDAVLAELDAKGHEALGVSADVTDPAAVERVVQATLERFPW